MLKKPLQMQSTSDHSLSHFTFCWLCALVTGLITLAYATPSH